MATTSSRGYPYPTLADSNNPPADIQALAEAVDTDVAALVAAKTAWRGYLATTDSIVNGDVWDTVALTPDFQTPSPWSGSASYQKLLPLTGLYMATVCGVPQHLSVSGTGKRLDVGVKLGPAGFSATSAGTLVVFASLEVSASIDPTIRGIDTFLGTAGQEVAMVLKTNNGAALNISAGTTKTFLDLVFLG